MPLLLTNATVSTARANVTVLTNVRVALQPPKNEVFSGFGGAILGEIWFDESTDVRQGDLLTLVAMDGMPNVDTVSTYKLINPHGVAGLIPYKVAQVEGWFI